jgi:hypothetical protein
MMNRLVSVLLALLLLSGCMAPAQGTPEPEVIATADIAPESVGTVTATPDPLYALNCIHQSGRANLCYAGPMLLEDYEKLEKTIVAFCNSRLDGACSVMVWKDEASVAQRVPLTDEETASRFARYSFPGNGTECFQVFDNGEVIFTTGDCP